MFETIKNKTIFANKYHAHPEAVIITCYFNPQNSPYRLKVFNLFYEKIKHLNHSIVECVIGDAQPQLPENESISRVYTRNLLWHKESLLNNLVGKLPKKYKYVFWVDADILFTNLDWLVKGVAELKYSNIIQPFEYCVHLEKDELKPSFNMEILEKRSKPNQLNNKVWRSFCSNYAKNSLFEDTNYNTHGHVGFAWGAKREILDTVALYDKALIGGADHIIAHAAAGQIPSECITKSFKSNLDEVTTWSLLFSNVIKKKIGYVPGNLYHLWHGNIEKREYLKRIQEFNPTSKKINKRDNNGLFVSEQDDAYIHHYFKSREVPVSNFLDSMIAGYSTNSEISDNIPNIKEQIFSTEQNTEFGGGSFGGAGASGDWSDNSNISIDDVTPDNSITENFS